MVWKRAEQVGVIYRRLIHMKYTPSEAMKLAYLILDSYPKWPDFSDLALSALNYKRQKPKPPMPRERHTEIPPEFIERARKEGRKT